MCNVHYTRNNLMEGEIVHEEKVKIELLFALYKYDISYSDVTGF